MHITVLATLLAIQSVAPQTPDTIITSGPQRNGAKGGMLQVEKRFEMPKSQRLVVDTPQEIIEYTDAYSTRLTIHRWASYAMVPLFAFQYAAGRELYDESSDAPSWATKGHGIAATAVAGLFTVNTVTGTWNLIEARKDPEGRVRRTVHGVLMLIADGGFAATGLLAEKAERNPDTRRLHRDIALSSMAVAGVSFAIMVPALFGN